MTETFILREVDEMERQGQPVLLVPLIRESTSVIHDAALPWLDRALFTPWLGRETVRAQLQMARRAPFRYLATLLAALYGNARSIGHLWRTAALLPKAVHLAVELERRGVRHVHAHFATHPTTVAWVIHRLTGISYSLTAHAHDLFVSRVFLGPKLRAARFVRVISRFNREFLCQHFPGLEERIEVIHTGVDPGWLAAGSAAPPAEGSTSLIACVAALKPYKGHEVLLEALERLQEQGLDFQCVLVGEGPLRQQLEHTLERRRLAQRVRLLGARKQDEVRDILRRATVVVQPSVVASDGQMEGIPVTLMEAMALGRAVVATRLSGIPELIDDGVDGLLVEPGEARLLADALRRALQEPELRLRLGRAATRSVADSFLLDTCVASLLERIDAAQDPVPSWVVEALVASGARDEIGATGLLRELEGRDARVAVLATRDGSEIVLKEHRTRAGESRPAPERAARELELLRSIGSAMAGGWRGSTARLGVPQPLGGAPGRGVVLMTSCPGIRLDRALRDLRFEHGGAARLEEPCRLAGSWLRRFQTVVTPPGQASEPPPLVARARARVADAGSLPHAQRLRLARDVEELCVRLSGDPASSTACHGDFWCGNVYWSPGELEVIDLEGVGVGHAEEDVVCFLAHLTLFFALPMPGLRRRGRRLARAFLSGYGLEPAAIAASPVWRLCEIETALRLLAARAAAGAGSPGSLAERFRRSALRSLACGGGRWS
ncbi:MAG TPA: glycosyltransferase [Planctomycetota bacterium]|nr:glycosyltransferase [Planctomycetota bacterium]